MENKRELLELENRLNALYDKKNGGMRSTVVIDSISIEELTNEHIDELNQFHATEVAMIEKEDSYFCGLRANHFVVEVGWSESREENVIVYLITCNHKGLRAMTMMAMTP